MELSETLRRHWGYDAFKPLQREAVEAALAGRDSLVVLPTGGGKSLCYQLPAALDRGLVLVVSPLIALMDDQVDAARQAGLAADALHSNLESSHRGQAWRRLAAGETRLLYVSPERLLLGDLLPLVGPRMTLAAVDEAHCVSHWGHEFRPEYRRLAEVLDRFPKAARMALTATATPEVRDDIALGMALRDPVRLVGHPDRPNLVYRAFPRTDSAAQVIAAVRRHEGEGGIVYAQTRRDVERLAAALSKAGVPCAPYHAGLPAAERRAAQESFVDERLAVIVATIAFGMGIDRSNVRFVVHANTPRSVEHYQQESGRAGRDGLPAECTLLFSVSDLVLHRALAEKDGELPPDRKRALERQLRDIGRFAAAPVCRHRLLTEHFGAPWPPPDAVPGEEPGCGACDVCLGETRSLPDDEALLTAKKILSAAWRMEGRYGAGYVVKLLLGKSDERTARNGHESLRVFGILADSGEPAVRWWVDQLVVQGQLEVVEEGEYPLLRITAAGRALCRDGGSVRLGIPPVKARKAGKAPRVPGGARTPAARRAAAAIVAGGAWGGGAAAGPGPGPAAEPPLPVFDETLFQRLRDLRRRFAEEQKVPPYVVFHDSTLVEMAALRPRTLETLRHVKGVGERKLERYGEAFLDAIAGGSPPPA